MVDGELKNDIVSYVEKVESKLKDITRHEESYFRKGVEIIDEIMPNNVAPKEYYMKKLIDNKQWNAAYMYAKQGYYLPYSAQLLLSHFALTF